jgi:hypothetical protein
MVRKVQTEVGVVCAGLYVRAHARVDRSPRLSKYKAIIFADWSEGNDHLRWVIRGKVSEIESWAEQIRRDSHADG